MSYTPVIALEWDGITHIPVSCKAFAHRVIPSLKASGLGRSSGNPPVGDSLEAVVKANSIEDVVYRDACRPESRLSIHLVYRIAIYSYLRKNGYRPITLDNRWSRPDRRSNRIVPISVSGFLAHIAISHGYPLCGCGQIISLLKQLD